MSSIEDGMQRTSRDFDSFVAKNVTMEWDKQKARIFEHFGLFPKTDIGVMDAVPGSFGASMYGRLVPASKIGKGASTLGSNSVWARSIGSSILGKPAQASTRGSFFMDVDPEKKMTISRQVQTRQQTYVTAVRKLNEARLAGVPFPILKSFEDITAALGLTFMCIFAN